MSYGRRYGGRRYNYGKERAKAHIDEATIFSDEVGGSDQIVKDAFFALSGKSREYLFEEYASLYGKPARDYAQQTVSKWKSGEVRMSGMVAKRLFALMPPYLPMAQKHRIVETIWKRYGPRSRKFLYIGPDSAANAVNAEVERYFANLNVVYDIPASLEHQFDWLSDNDVAVKQQLLNHFMNEQRNAAIMNATLHVDVILGALNAENAGQIQKLVHTVFVGNHQLELRADALRTGYLLSDLDHQEVEPKPSFKWPTGFVVAAVVIGGFWLFGSLSSGPTTTSSASVGTVQNAGQNSQIGQSSSGGSGDGSGGTTTASTQNSGGSTIVNAANSNGSSGFIVDPTSAPRKIHPQSHPIHTAPAPISAAKTVAAVTTPAIAGPSCFDTSVETVQDNGEVVRLASGGAYEILDNGLMRTYSQMWSTGDAVTVCGTPSSASIAVPNHYQKVQAALISTAAASDVSCSDSMIVRVSDDASTVDLTNGNSYEVSTAGLMRTYTSGWSTGDTVELCRAQLPDGTIAASIDVPNHYQKVQSTLVARNQATQVSCRDSGISSVGEAGSTLQTRDGRSYTISPAGLMRTYAQMWTPGDEVTVCESRSPNGTVAASIAERVRYQKIQATRS